MKTLYTLIFLLAKNIQTESQEDCPSVNRLANGTSVNEPPPITSKMRPGLVRTNFITTYENENLRDIKYLIFSDDEGKLQAYNEVKALIALKKIPGVISLYECFQSNYYFVLYLQHLDADIFFNSKRLQLLNSAEIFKLLAFIADTVHQIHEAGWTHGNLKPEYIIFVSPNENQVRLSGFDHARPLNQPSSKNVMGLVAPEIACKSGPILHKPSTDVWALGIMFLEILGDFSTVELELDCRHLIEDENFLKVWYETLVIIVSQIIKKVQPEFLAMFLEVLDLNPEKRPSAAKFSQLFDQQVTK